MQLKSVVFIAIVNSLLTLQSNVNFSRWG